MVSSMGRGREISFN